MTRLFSYLLLAVTLAAPLFLSACQNWKYERSYVFDNNCSHHAWLPPGDGFCEKYTAGP